MIMSKNETVPLGTLIAATFLVAGACIGGGMLALPAVTASAGFYPSFFWMFISWVFMAGTGLLYVEANLWMEEGAHVMTMSSKLLGRFGKYLSVAIYLFMGYASLVAYTDGGGILIGNSLEQVFEIHLSHTMECVVFALVFGSMITLGTRLIGRINSILVVGMILSYFGLVTFGISGVKETLLSRYEWKGASFALPLILASFSYQMMVPSLTPYLKRDPKSLRFAVICGSAIPFVVYSVWELIVLGTIPLTGENGLATLDGGRAVTELVRAMAHNPLVSTFSDFFAFFALVTSYLGIALGTHDFVADAIHAKRRGIGTLKVSAIVVVPTLLFSITYPNAFIEALELSGGFGDSILSGLLPVAMVWMGRYVKKIEGPYTGWGGKPRLIMLGGFALFVFILQIIKL